MQGFGAGLAEGAAGHDGEHAGAGGRFQDGVRGPDAGCAEGGPGERKRSRELLVAELVLGAAGLGGLEGREAPEHLHEGGVGVAVLSGVALHGGAVALEEQDDRGLGCFVGVFPGPGAGGIGSAEGGGQCVAQCGGVERASLLEGGQKGEGGGVEGPCAGGGGARDRGGGVEGRGRRKRERGGGGGNRVEHRGAPIVEAGSGGRNGVWGARVRRVGREGQPRSWGRGAGGRSRGGPWRGS